MTLPRLNRKLVLETEVRAPDLAGGYTTYWQALGTIWAGITPGTGSARGVQAVHPSRVPFKITVRAAATGSDARPRPGQRFREGARVYAILSVNERDTQGRYLMCRAQEVVSS